MKSIKIVSAGFGGQGVLTVGQMIAMMAMKKGLSVSWMPSYGPEMRGGTANCHVVIDEVEVSSPIISEGITHLLAMNQPALDKFLDKTSEDAVIVINSTLVHMPLVQDKHTIIALDFNAIALEVGHPKVQNMAALGALTHALNLFSEAEGLAVIEEKFGLKNPELTKLNQAAFSNAYHR